MCNGHLDTLGIILECKFIAAIETYSNFHNSQKTLLNSVSSSVNLTIALTKVAPNT